MPETDTETRSSTTPDDTRLSRFRQVLTNGPDWSCPSLSWSADDRGQAMMVGMVFIIVIILGLMTFAQTTIAPQVRNEAEIKHGSQVVTDFQGIHGDTLTAATSGQQGATVLQMGTDYPSSVILLHPPDPAGALRIGDPGTLQLSNVEAVNNETNDHLDGGDITYEHQPLRYSPIYNEFRTAGDNVIELGAHYQDYDSSVEVVGQPNIVEGNTIRLTATTGDMDTSSQSGKLVETEPLSASRKTVVVEDTGSSPEVRFESNLEANTWETILSEEIDPSPVNLNNDRYISDVRDGGGNTVVIELEPGTTYELNTAKLHYKTSDQAAAPESDIPDVAYLTTQQANKTTTPTDGKEQFTVEVRDTFNNPEANVPLDVQTARSGSDAELVSRVSRTDGTVTVLYTAPSSSTPPEDKLTVCIENCATASNKELVEFTINIDS